jgi:carboxyl-terminal processing protease
MTRRSLWLCLFVALFLSAACSTNPSFRSLKPDAASQNTPHTPSQSAPVTASQTTAKRRPSPSHVDASPRPDIEVIDDAMKLIEVHYIAQVTQRTLQQACLTALEQPPPTTDDPAAARAAIVDALDRSSASNQSEHPSPAADRCLRAMVRSLDAHSNYFSPREFEELQFGGRHAGIGIELARADEGAQVVAAIPGGPAARAGIKGGTTLIKIDDRELRKMPLSDITRLLRGEPGSPVRITLRKPDQSEPYSLTLQRELIRVEAVHVRLIEPGLAVVRLTQFNESTAKKMADGLADLKADDPQPLKGIILDLRGCTGGLLNAAVAIGAAFLPANALVLYTEGRTDDSRMRLYSAPEYYIRPGKSNPFTRLPPEAKTARMVVLVNEATAAGAEAVVAALQDHNRATVVGTRTFGGGSIQTILPLKNNTALKLTTGTMFRPKRVALQDNGVTPDVAIPQSAAGSATSSGDSAAGNGASSGDQALAEAISILKKP